MEMEGYFLWTQAKKLLTVVTLAALAIITAVAMSRSASFYGSTPSREEITTLPENYRPPIEELDPQTVKVKVTSNQAIRCVQDVWPSVAGVSADATLIRDVLSGRVLWLLEYKVDGAVIVSALVDAERGKVISLADFRRSARVDNIKNTDKAVAIAANLLEKLGVELSQVSNPTVAIRRIPNTDLSQEIIYEVQWRQVYKGIQVMGGIVLVEIDAETLSPVGFSTLLLDVNNVDINASISKEQAVNVAKNFVENAGCKVGEVIDAQLVIGRPNYYWEGSPTELGDPALMWNVLLKDGAGKRIDVWVDAKTGSVVGGTLYR